jgi:ABC-type polysaccharide/polyol phosphate export permease
MVKRIPGTLFLHNLVERRSLLFQLVRRDFEQRFVGSAIGWVWGLIHPLVLLVSWTFVFQVCLKVQLDSDAPTRNFPLYLFSGMLPWLLFSDTVQRSASSVLDQANLITKTVFPAEIVPVSVFLSTLVSHLLALVLMLAAAGYWLRVVSPYLFLLPLAMLGIGLFAVGLGWVMAGLHVFLRDTAQVLSVILTFWFWLTPIMITEKQVPAWARFLLVANPMRYAVSAYRQILLTPAPPRARDFVVLGACGAVTFVIGGLFFRHMKRGFADVL